MCGVFTVCFCRSWRTLKLCQTLRSWWRLLMVTTVQMDLRETNLTITKITTRRSPPSSSNGKLSNSSYEWWSFFLCLFLNLPSISNMCTLPFCHCVTIFNLYNHLTYQVHVEEKQARQQLSIICSSVRGGDGWWQRGIRIPHASLDCKTTHLSSTEQNTDLQNTWFWWQVAHSSQESEEGSKCTKWIWK